MTDRMNVLLIVIDQFRADLLEDSALGREARLPHLRALQDEAFRCPAHYSVTTPCGPSRVSMLTGQYTMNHGATRNGTPLRHDTPTLATELRKLGYAPRLYGYTDTAQDPRVLPADDPRLASYEELMAGFDEAVRMRMETDDSAWRAHLAAKGLDLPPYPECYRSQDGTITGPALYAAEDSDTAFLTDRFLDDMAGFAPGWCAAVTYIRPHPPFVAPAPYNAMYDPADMPSAADASDHHPFVAAAQARTPPGKTVVGVADVPVSDATTAALRAVYLGLASEVDHHIGRIVAALKASGQWDRTLLVVTGDHGEMLGDYGLWGKSTFHDAAFKVPLILRDPARPGSFGQAGAGFTESIDLPVTILDRLGAAAPDAMNGKSLLPLLDNPARPLRETSFSEHDFGDPIAPNAMMQALDLPAKMARFAVLRTETHRLTFFAGPQPVVLFDVCGPGESLNLAPDPGHAEILLDLVCKMLCHRMVNPDGTFARTMIGAAGVQRGDA